MCAPGFTEINDCTHFLQEPPTFVGAEPKPVEAPKPVKHVEEEPPPRPVSIATLHSLESSLSGLFKDWLALTLAAVLVDNKN
jgi:hypothetical protein